MRASTAAVSIAAFTILCFASPFLVAPLAAQQHDMGHDMSSMKDKDPTHAAMHGGKMPAGWHLRLDDPKAATKDVAVHQVGKAIHVMTGPATILWRNSDKVSGNFAVNATFEQMELPEHPEAYGVVFGGSNLDKADQSYFYFLIRHDGRFLVNHRAGADVHKLIDWSLSPAIVKPDAKGHSLNKLTVDAGKDQVRFMINGKQVASFGRENPMPPAGIAGLRVNHNLEVHVNNFAVVKK